MKARDAKFQGSDNKLYRLLSVQSTDDGYLLINNYSNAQLAFETKAEANECLNAEIEDLPESMSEGAAQFISIEDY